MNIRTATLADLDALHDLVHRAYRGDSARQGWTHEADLLDGQRTDREALTEMLSDGDIRVLVAEEGGALIGCVEIADERDGRAYLGMLSVEPNRQASGLGRRLIAAAESCAGDTFGARTMEMTVIRQRSELIDYYKRRGYALTGEDRPFPLADPRFGTPRRNDLAFVVLAKPLQMSNGDLPKR